MENLKPTQNHEQEQRKTLEDYVVKTFPADLDLTTRPLTVIRSGRDGGGVRPDGGWIPGDMLCVCDTDSEEVVGVPKLFVRVHKPIKIDGEYDFITKVVALDRLQGREANKGFSESYIQERYGKSTKEMLEEGRKAAEQIWQQKHPVDSENESLTAEVGSDSGAGAETSLGAETPSNSLAVEGASGHEKSLADKVGPVMGSVTVEATGVEKPISKDEVDDNPVDLVTVKPTKESVKTDRANTDLVDLPAVEPVKKPVETNEVNIGMLPEDFKGVIDNFEKHIRDNNNQFAGVARSLTGSLSELRELIIGTPAAIKDSRVTEFVTTASSRIREFEASRAKFTNKFKNDVSGLVEESKKKIGNDDEQRKRLIKLTEDVDEMSAGGTALGSSTNTLIDKLTEIVRIVSDAQGDGWGMDGYISRIVTVIGEIVDSDLPSVYGRRQSILNAIEAIKTAGD